MASLITMDGKYQTRGDTNHPSQPVRILCVDRGLRWPVLGLVTDKNGDEHVGTWDACGMQEFNTNQNLMLVPTKHKGWGVVNKKGELTAAFSDDYAWERAQLDANIFDGDRVVCLTWEA